jgi:hypothetical protein
MTPLFFCYACYDENTPEKEKKKSRKSVKTKETDGKFLGKWGTYDGTNT